MAVFSIIIGNQLEMLRDKGSLFFMLVFPTLLVAILGITLGNLDNPDETIDPMQIAYIVEDSPSGEAEYLASSTVEAFSEMEQVSLSEADDLQAAHDELARGELAAIVVFTADASIEIYEGSSSVQNRAVHAIFEGVSRMHAVSAIALGRLVVPDAAAASSFLAAPTDADTSQASAFLTAPPSAVSPAELFSNLPSRVEEQTFGITRTMIDYYAITMIVMMFFMGSAAAGASQLYEARKNHTLPRIVASPRSRVVLYLQYMLANVPFNLFQVAVVMASATLFLGAHYAVTWQDNLLLFVMLFIAGLASSSVFMVLGIFLRKTNPFMLLMPFMWVMLFLSGTFSKEIFIPGVSEYVPAALIQSAAFDLTLFGRPEQAVGVLLVSLALIVVSTTVGAFLFNRKEVAQ